MTESRRPRDVLQTSDSWQEVCGVMRWRLAGPTSEQRELGDRIGVDLPNSVPVPVAAALLQRALRGPLDLQPSETVSAARLNYAKGLSEATRIGITTDLDSIEVVNGWIEALQVARALAALETLQPEPGDVVGFLDEDGVEGFAAVSSISRHGRLNFRDGKGWGVRPHLARMVARARDGGPRFEEARYRARQRAALRREPNRSLSVQKHETLAQWKVDGGPSLVDVAALYEALESAPDERPLQQVLQEHPQLLASLVNSHKGAYVRSQVSFGGKFIADFVVGGLTSGGLHWTLVELESPTVRLNLRDGQAANELRKALKQIDDWREWLLQNLDTARRDPSEHGLGLFDIRPQARALIVIGRESRVGDADELRDRIRENQQVEVRTYDWLVGAARQRRHIARGRLDEEAEDALD